MTRDAIVKINGLAEKRGFRPIGTNLIISSLGCWFTDSDELTDLVNSPEDKNYNELNTTSFKIMNFNPTEKATLVLPEYIVSTPYQIGVNRFTLVVVNSSNFRITDSTGNMTIYENATTSPENGVHSFITGESPFRWYKIS